MFGKRNKNTPSTSLGSKISKAGSLGTKLFNILNPLVITAAPFLATNPIGQGILLGAAGLNLFKTIAETPGKIKQEFVNMKDDLMNDIDDIKNTATIQRDSIMQLKPIMNPF